MRLFILFIGIFLIASGCHNEVESEHFHTENEQEYFVSISISSPEMNQSLRSGDELDVRVKFERKGDLVHHIKIAVLDNNNNEIRVLHDKHEHKEDSVIYEGSYKTSSPGEFKLSAISTDDQKKNPNTRSNTFIVESN